MGLASVVKESTGKGPAVELQEREGQDSASQSVPG